MKHWIIMCRAETYELVKEHKTIGVAAPHGARFSELDKGDKFVVYISGRCLLDGYGVLTSRPFVDLKPIFGSTRDYPHRCRVRFECVGAEKDAREVLWGLSPFTNRTLKTVPANYIFLKGGFMEISEADFHWLRTLLEEKPALTAN